MIVVPYWCEFTELPEGGEIPPVIVRLDQLPFHDAEYWMPQGSVLDKPPDWSFTRKGEKIKIPLNSYLLPGSTTYDAWAAGVQLGARAIHWWHEHTRHKRRLHGMVLAVGHNLPPAETGQRQFLGLALATDKTSS